MLALCKPYIDVQDYSHKVPQYIECVLQNVWKESCKLCKTFSELRQYMEHVLTSELGLHAINHSTAILKAIKSALVGTEECATACALCLASLAQRCEDALCKSSKFFTYVLQQETEVFYSTCRKIRVLHPIFACSVESMQKVLDDISTCNDIGQLTNLAQTIGFEKVDKTSVWPLLALYEAQQQGIAEDLYLNCPLPQVLGYPSNVPIGITSSTITKWAKPYGNLDFKNVVLCNKGTLCTYNAKEGVFKLHNICNAHLVCALPGVSKTIWCVNAQTFACSFVRMHNDGTPQELVQFDLPVTEDELNWIDCQRDNVGNLVLRWSNKNSITGSVQTVHQAAFDELQLLEHNTIAFLDTCGELPDRFHASFGSFDYRDHGNVLSLHYTIKEEFQSRRQWNHMFEVLFGLVSLLVISTPARPIQDIYGTPYEFFVLSPLSNRPLQKWAFSYSAEQGAPNYKMVSTYAITESVVCDSFTVMYE